MSLAADPTTAIPCTSAYDTVAAPTVTVPASTDTAVPFSPVTVSVVVAVDRPLTVAPEANGLPLAKSSVTASVVPAAVTVTVVIALSSTDCVGVPRPGVAAFCQTSRCWLSASSRR